MAPLHRLRRFGPFELNLRTGELRKNGYRVRLPEQSFQVLSLLLDRPGELVLREEIQQRLWPNNTVVEFDHSINTAIKNLRQALGETGDRPRYIETIPRRGYRFLGELIEDMVPEPDADPAPLEPAAAPVECFGKVFSNYRILEKLGEGGMGVVYRAEDTRLGRFVAIKLLPSSDPEIPEVTLRRFEQEARAASVLNHPNICTIHGLEEIDGRTAIVMELIDGETLGQRLAKSPLSNEDALRFAIQIAAALVEAHRKGVVHRDLKPANIMLAKSGVKVLDFGIAKMESTREGGTIPGTVLGTLHYLSPEQADGQEADARSDIFSFGVVLHEMLTGKRPFQGDDLAGAPAPLARIVRRCLAQNAEERWQSAEDLKTNLEWFADAPAAEPLPLNRLSWVAVTAVAVLAVVAGIAAWMRPATAPQRNWTLSLGAIGEAEVSPDGSGVLHRSPRGLILRRLDSLDEIPLSVRVGDEPYWAADSSRIGFQSDPFGFTRMSLPNGLAEVSESELGPERGCTWAPDGTVLLASVGKLYMLTPGSHSPKRVEVSSLTGGSFYRPEFLPNGKHILFAWANDSDTDVGLYLANWENGRITKPVFLRRNLTAGHYSPAAGGRLLYVQNDNLYAQKLNVSRGVLEGPPEHVVDGVFSEPVLVRPHFSVSRNGVLVWQAGRAALAELTWFDRTGKVLGTMGPLCYSYPVRLSPDERHVLLYTPIGGVGYGISEIDHGGVVALKDVDDPIWMPDGAHILFQRKDGTGNHVLERALEGGREKEIVRIQDLWDLNEISPDGTVLLYRTRSGLYSLPLNHPGATASAVAESVRGSLSPDGRWVAYMRDDQIYAQRFPLRGLPFQLTSNRGSHPLWGRSGKEILYLNGNMLCSLHVEVTGGIIRAGPQQVLFRVRRPGALTSDEVPMAETRDGSRILFAEGVEQPDPPATYVMTAWDALLRH